MKLLLWSVKAPQWWKWDKLQPLLSAALGGSEGCLGGTRPPNPLHLARGGTVPWAPVTRRRDGGRKHALMKQEFHKLIGKLKQSSYISYQLLAVMKFDANEIGHPTFCLLSFFPSLAGKLQEGTKRESGPS